MINRVVQDGKVILQGMKHQYAVLIVDSNTQEIVRKKVFPYMRHLAQQEAEAEIFEGLIEYESLETQ